MNENGLDENVNETTKETMRIRTDYELRLLVDCE